MWIKAAVLGGSGIILSNLAVWTMVGLGIKIAFHSSREWVNSVDVAREEKDNEISRLPDDEKDNEISRLLDEENDNEIDRLPDDILCDIVSRLNLIEASRTSILSRRWRNFWTMKSELCFMCVSLFDILNNYHTQVANCDKRRFFKAVDQCLQLYSDHGRKLETFILHCCFLNGHTCDLVRWMQTLARFDVEYLSVGESCDACRTDNSVRLEEEYTFSFKLIDGLSRLADLHLENCYLETSFVGRCVSITRIFLVRLQLLSHQLSDILMSCPNLIHLFMLSVNLPLNLRISGPNLKLRCLELCYCFDLEKIEISDINVRAVVIDIRYSEVEISLSSLPQIKKLDLGTSGMNCRFRDVTRDLPELENLIFNPPYQILRLPPTFRAFRNIRGLYLLTSGDPLREGCEKVDLWNFAPVLDACPFLEKFYLAIGGPVCSKEEEERRRNAEWPVVRHKHLSFMELSGFSNTQNELEFARFILTSAQVLRSFDLQVCLRKSDIANGFHIDEDEKDSKQMDAGVAEALCADLKGHALSIHAQVTLL